MLIVNIAPLVFSEGSTSTWRQLLCHRTVAVSSSVDLRLPPIQHMQVIRPTAHPVLHFRT